MAREKTLQEQLDQVKADLAAAVADLERLLWLSGICKYCAKGKGKGHKWLDRPCTSCEPVWRGPKGKNNGR